MNDYYTYAYIREDGSPYYIGKGRGKRAIIPHYGCKVKRPSMDRILYLKTNLTEQEAFKHEIYMINVLGRKDLGTGILRNGTNGGEGYSTPHTEETKRKIGDALRGRPTGRREGAGQQRGKARDPLTRQKISDTLMGRPNPHNDTKGRVWVNDGKKSYMIHPPLPPHLKKGRI